MRNRAILRVVDADFRVVAFAFLVVMALETVPSPIYGLYRARDHFWLFVVTVAFVVYAVGVIATLLLARHPSDLYGRRLVLPPVGISIANVVVLLMAPQENADREDTKDYNVHCAGSSRGRPPSVASPGP